MNRFFESSYLSWEILPAANADFIKETFSHLIYLEENERDTWKYADTVDYYFNQRPVGGERPTPLSGMLITYEAFKNDLSRYGLVSTTPTEFVPDHSLDPYRILIRTAGCYSNDSYALFFDIQYGILQQLWFDYEDHISLEDDRQQMIDLLYTLGNRYSLVLVDWYEKRIIDLRDKDIILKYLQDVAAGFGFWEKE